MNEIANHISYLLTQHNCVSIPQLGGFVIQHEEAIFDQETLAVKAPHNTLSFNEAITHDDGLLTQSIMQAKGISYNKALQYIKTEIEKFKQQLTLSPQGIICGELGLFLYNEEKKLLFIGGEKATCDIDHTGYKTLTFEKEAVTITPPKNEQKQGESIPLIPSQSIPVKSSFAFIRNIAALLAIIFLFFSTPIQSPQKLQLAQLNIGDLIQEKQEKAMAWVADSDTIAATQVASSHTYYIIIASLPNQTLAEEEVDNLSQYGITNLKIVHSEGTQRVRLAIASSHNEKEANAKLIEIQQQFKRFAKAWILTQEEL